MGNDVVHSVRGLGRDVQRRVSLSVHGGEPRGRKGTEGSRDDVERLDGGIVVQDLIVGA